MDRLPVPQPHTDSAAHPAPAVVQRELRALWRYVRMHGASAEVAEELCQEAFVIAAQKGALGAAPAAIAVFLRRTARHLWLRHIGRDRRREAVQLADAVDELWQQECADDGGDARVAALRACVEQLPARTRRALQLGYGFDDEVPASRARIAGELGLTENGVKTLMQRLRATLRDCIERRRSR